MGEKKRFFSAVAVLVGTCIGAGVLGIPYVAAKAGFFVALFYILFIGSIVLLVNLYLGEVVLRTKGNHQIVGYIERYLGNKGKIVAQIAMIFGIYSAIVAYLLGIGNSFSFLFFEDFEYAIYFGVGVGVAMSGLLYRGMKALKRFERIGVAVILILFCSILISFFNKIDLSNLVTYDSGFLFLPFGLILFALTSFYAVPELKIILKRDKKKLREVLFIGTFVSVIFYILFSLVVVGYMGSNTPEVATLALGAVFIILGIFTMFTSYLALGNALIENLKFDEKMSERRSWFFASIIPIFLFVLVSYFEFFSFVVILSIGGVVSGGLLSILILLMIGGAKKNGDRKPEYSIPVNWFVIVALSLVFVLGMIFQFVF